MTLDDLELQYLRISRDFAEILVASMAKQMKVLPYFSERIVAH